MRPIKAATAWSVVAIAIGSAYAPGSYASSPPNPEPEEASWTAFPGSAKQPSTSDRPLFAKEMAVLTAQRISPERARQALDVQGKIARTDLVPKLQVAMGSAYAEAWFDNATAQLHIGVTSQESRRTAERVAAGAGLAAQVTVTPVRSTSAQLVAAQNQWGRRLAQLYGPKSFMTGLDARHNGVSVTLSSAVPSQERAVLEREGSIAGVNVFVIVSASSALGVAPAANECNNFPPEAPNCNKSITGGVQIEGGGQGCTAGPAAIPEAKPKERVLLTAGHCIKEAGGPTIEWFAFTRKAEKLLIGKAGAFRFGSFEEGKLLGDFGEIPIEAGGGWQTGNANDPVLAATAEWKKAANTRYPIKGEKTPTEGMVSCHEGGSSGESCGVITLRNVKGLVKEKWVEGMVMVEEPPAPKEQLIGEPGDSGGPALFVEANADALAEGTLIGVGTTPKCNELPVAQKGRQFFKVKGECLNLVFKEIPTNEGVWERKLALFFNPLIQPEGGGFTPGPLQVFKLKLLTTANEIIAKGELPETLPMSLSERTWTGKSEGEPILKLAENEVKCKEATTEGTEEIHKSTGTFHINFKSCTSIGVKCTGLGDETGTVLSLGTWHLVWDKKTELLTATLFLLEPMHFTCSVLLMEVKGEMLCLDLKPSESNTTHSHHCIAEGAKQTGKWFRKDNGVEAVEEVTPLLLCSVNHAAFKECAGLMLGGITYKESIFADV